MIAGAHGTRRRGRLGEFDARIGAMRADPRRRASLLGAILLGGLLAGLHWLGLVLAGALIGITRATTPRAVLAGAAFGLGTVGATVVLAPAVGAAEFAALDPVNYLSVGVALAAPGWGALARWVV